MTDKQRYFVFHYTISGEGPDYEAALAQAIEAFQQDPGEPDRWSEEGTGDVEAEDCLSSEQTAELIKVAAEIHMNLRRNK